MSFSRKGAIRKNEGRTYGAIRATGEPRLTADPTQGSVNSLKSGNTISRLQGQVLEVKEILKDNIEKVIERDDKVATLADRTENLAVTSTAFRGSATDLRKHTQRRNWKLTCCIVCVVVIVLCVIAVVVLYVLKII